MTPDELRAYKRNKQRQYRGGLKRNDTPMTPEEYRARKTQLQREYRMVESGLRAIREALKRRDYRERKAREQRERTRKIREGLLPKKPLSLERKLQMSRYGEGWRLKQKEQRQEAA